MLSNIYLALLLFAQIKFSFCKRYDGYTLLQATPEKKNQLYFFHSLRGIESMGIEYWEQPGSIHHNVSFIVPEENVTLFLHKASFHGITVKTLMKNVQEAFDKQTSKAYIRRNMDTFDWKSFYSLESIYAWLEDLADKYSDRVKLVSMGRSHEGRNILGIFLHSKGNFTIFVEGGIHAREWISPAFVTYLIHQLVTARDTTKSDLLYAVKNYSWHLFPVLNPDGYVYTHKQDRNWRKNRQRYGHGTGVDLNRNFDYNFGSVGVSHDAGRDVYCGPRAFSEPETKAASEYISKIGSELMFYFSFHSYGQYFVIPYANTIAHRGNYRQVKRLGELGLSKLSSLYNTHYKIGNAYETVGYVVSGNSVDWVKSTFKVPVAVNMELRDDGTFGFALPPNEILPTCKETLACVLEMLLVGPLGASDLLDDEQETMLRMAKSGARRASWRLAALAPVLSMILY